jgi:hypothetical protein
MVQTLRQISPEDFALLGVQRIAYIKPVVVDGESAFEIHAADGTKMAVVADREVAFAAVRQHDLEPLSVH